MIHHKAVNVYFSDEKKAKIRSIIGPNGLLVEESKKNEVSTILGCDLKVPRHLLPGETACSLRGALSYDVNHRDDPRYLAFRILHPGSRALNRFCDKEVMWLYFFGGRRISEIDIPDPQKLIKFQKRQTLFLCMGGAHQCLVKYGYRLDGIFGKTERELYEIGLSLYPDLIGQFGDEIIQIFINPFTLHDCCAWNV